MPKPFWNTSTSRPKVPATERVLSRIALSGMSTERNAIASMMPVAAEDERHEQRESREQVVLQVDVGGEEPAHQDLRVGELLWRVLGEGAGARHDAHAGEQ